MGVTLVTRREDVERVFDVGHGWGGGRRNESVGGAGGIYRRGWGILRHIEPEPRVFYVGDGNPGRFGFKRANWTNEPGQPPFLIPHPSRRLLNCSRFVFSRFSPFSSRKIRSLVLSLSLPILSSPPLNLQVRRRRVIIGKLAQFRKAINKCGEPSPVTP